MKLQITFILLLNSILAFGQIEFEAKELAVINEVEGELTIESYENMSLYKGKKCKFSINTVEKQFCDFFNLSTQQQLEDFFKPYEIPTSYKKEDYLKNMRLYDNKNNYYQLDSKYTVVGGETCTPPTSYSQCNAALQTMGKYHWSYLNLSYHQDIIADWKNTHCFEEIQKRLGYRFVMKEVQYTEKIESGKNYKLILNFENKGFASPYNPRSAYIKFRSVSDGRIHFSHQIQSNPQFWFTGNHRLEISVNLPSHLPAGDYDVLLHLPDASMSIADKAEYAVRFANINTWEAATGYNKLYTQTKK